MNFMNAFPKKELSPDDTAKQASRSTAMKAYLISVSLSLVAAGIYFIAALLKRLILNFVSFDMIDVFSSSIFIANIVVLLSLVPFISALIMLLNGNNKRRLPFVLGVGAIKITAIVRAVTSTAGSVLSFIALITAAAASGIPALEPLLREDKIFYIILFISLILLFGSLIYSGISDFLFTRSVGKRFKFPDRQVRGGKNAKISSLIAAFCYSAAAVLCAVFSLSHGFLQAYTYYIGLLYCIANAAVRITWFLLVVYYTDHEPAECLRGQFAHSD